MTQPEETPAASQASQAIEEIARTSYGRMVAYLSTVTGDLAAAEDALGDALLAALRTWPERGVPARPDSWLITAARRKVVDAARRRSTADAARMEVARVMERNAERLATGAVVDERLRLMFVCAHPSIAESVRSPLMLQTILGLDAVRIGRAFLVAPTTMGQRLVRAKAKIKAARIPFTIPEGSDLGPRLGSVLEAIYAAFGTAWDDIDETSADPGLAEEAIRLARVVATLLPEEPETHGLVALLLHSHARAEARRSAGGDFVRLADQDTDLWSQPLMREAESHLRRALAASQPGPFQVKAAIQSVHNLRAVTGRTDWVAIATLYDGLATLAPVIGTLVARAAAHREAHGAAAGLAALDEIPSSRVAAYQPYWVVRAWCEADLRSPDARRTVVHALELTESPLVADFLRSAFGDLLED